MTDRLLGLGIVTAILALFVIVLILAGIQHNERLRCLEKDIANRAVLCAPENPDTPPPPAKPLSLGAVR